MSKNKTLFKILAILLLIVGIVLIVFGFIDIVKVTTFNKSLLPGEEPRAANLLYPLLATPCMFAGVFLFALGFGKSKQYV
ncbi:MAG: hypothetical protein ACOX3C_04480 [Bacilli bacterium]|jgi:hypothetical protein